MTLADLESFLTSPQAAFLAGLGVFCLALGIVLRIICGASSGLCSTSTTCLAIVFIYIISFTLYGVDAHSNVALQAFNSASLPLVPILADFSGVFVAFKKGFGLLFTELVQMFTLAFTVDAMDKLISKVTFNKRNFFSWYFRQCVVVVAAIVVNTVVDYALRELLPDFLAKWLPALLFILIGVVSVLALLGQIFKRVAFFANPILGGLVSFFSINPVGKAYVSAFLATIILLLAVLVLEMLGLADYLVVAGGAIGGYFSSMLIVVPLWYAVYLIVWKK